METIFIVGNNHNFTKVITFLEGISKTKVMNDALETSLEFADVSSYLTYKFSACKRGCTISFELQLPQTSSTTSWKALANFYEG